MNPLPRLRKAPARKAPVKTPMFEYVKFWLPFLLTIVASFVAFMSKISVLETKVDAQYALIQELRRETLGRDTLDARHEACLARHGSTEREVASIERKIDGHIEKGR